MVTGSIPQLGGEEPDTGLTMSPLEGACYMAEALLPLSVFPFRCARVGCCPPLPVLSHAAVAAVVGSHIRTGNVSMQLLRRQLRIIDVMCREAQHASGIQQRASYPSIPGISMLAGSQGPP